MPDNFKPPLDLTGLRAGLEKSGGKKFWRSLDELAETKEYQEAVECEFRAPAKPGAVSRRNLLKLMAASAGLAGLTACTKMPVERIVPYVRPPEEFAPGKKLFYATSYPTRGGAIGLLVESHMGRPTKIEGNPDHPASLGATDIFSQASILNMYDPDRSRVIFQEGQPSSWSDFLEAAQVFRTKYLAKKGAGLYIVTETVTSPTFGDQLAALLAQFPAAKWLQYEPVNRDNAYEGALLAFGEPVNTVYHFDRADTILSLDSDFLAGGYGGSVRYAWDFSNRRRVADTRSSMNRLYVTEAMPSITGSMADHRIPMRPSDVEAFARAVAAALGVKVSSPGAPSQVPAGWLAALVKDLQSHRGTSIVLAGDQQPPAVHALAHAMNQALGNVGQTVVFTDPIEVKPSNQTNSVRELAADIAAGKVETLVMLGGNLVYDVPADLDFATLLPKVDTRISLSLYTDETAVMCDWQIPTAHYLESWSDCRAYDGTACIVQPLIAPLYDGKTAHEVLGALLGDPGKTPHEWVREYWSRQFSKNADFERFWEASLEKGLIAGTAFQPKEVNLKSPAAFDQPPAAAPANALEIGFLPDPTIDDGRFSNNAWLQELPKPLNKMTWDNALIVSPGTAERLSLAREEVVRVTFKGRKLDAPILIQPGHADGAATIHFGYGRKRAGHVGNGHGFNAYALRNSDHPWFGPLDGSLEKTGRRFHLVDTQVHHLIKQDGKFTAEEESVAAGHRGLIRIGTLTEFQKDPYFAADPPDVTSNEPSLYPPYNYREGYQWGMSIDLNSCIGCNACIVACYSENNVAVVGKEQVDNGRIMQWIRVDSYYRGNLEDPEMYHEVLPCMMCENAPCEYVCPVGATMHSPDGLNLMIYNRCVGTRYCSNNCPYKVRRFNFELWSDYSTPSLYGLRNPDVTVRSRGVMEKCTYCVQRIQEAKIKTQIENREIRDLEVLTACQQVCPTQAIVFGNINEKNSKVSQLKAQSREFGLLRELNVRPRTTYLAKLRNPNPEIEPPAAGAGEAEG
jgi:MoCo/4Fe-4S cofactor protein with predicted Tat translocation signal